MDIEMSQWLKHQANSLLLDVRTPSEFTQGHIPRAVNLPLFSDEERAIIGTLYVQQGRQQAVDEGIRILGPRLWDYVSKARNMASGRPVSVYCWRGGMRSGFAAWLLELGGMKVSRLQGGYKAFRRYGESLVSETSWSLIVLGGATGSGKTPILHELKLLGEQVLDLEALAHHKGSVFGAIGQPAQPTTEQFINELYHELTTLDPTRRIWLESESKLIGRVFIPDGLWEVICHAPMVRLDIPLEVRAEHIVAEYGTAPIPELMAPFERIAKRLGGEQKQRAQEALLSGDLRTAVRIALGYYDKAYNRSLAKDWGTPMLTLSVCEDCPAQTARLLLWELEKCQKQRSV